MSSGTFMTLRGEQWDRKQARLPKCSWPGCESRAPYPYTGHEGMHEDDQFAESFCAYHEHEVWYISCVQDDVARELGIDLEFVE